MIGIALVAACAAALFAAVMAATSAAEASVRLLGRTRTRRLIEAEVKGADALDALMERPSRLAAASALWRAFSYACGGGLSAWAAFELAGPGGAWWSAPVAVGLAFVVLFAFGETLPRSLAVQNPEKVGLAAAGVALRVSAVLTPVARFFGAGWMRIAALITDEPVTDAWLTGDEHGTENAPDEDSAREDSEEAFIEAVVDFAHTIVREVMVPRTDMIGLEDTATVQEAVDIIGSSGLSRLPVYHETLDDICGVLYAKDLLLCVGKDTCPNSVAALVRDAYFVPETKPIDTLLVEMRGRKTHLALVADEYGGTAGLVTIEDLLEEIVGEIFDEYDRAEPMVIELEDGSLLLDGRVPIDDFNDLLGTAIELEADSIGGLFIELAGHIPAPGETIEVEGVRITAHDVEGTRIRRLLVQPALGAGEGENDAETHH